MSHAIFLRPLAAKLREYGIDLRGSNLNHLPVNGWTLFASQPVHLLCV